MDKFHLSDAEQQLVCEAGVKMWNELNNHRLVMRMCGGVDEEQSWRLAGIAQALCVKILMDLTINESNGDLSR